MNQYKTISLFSGAGGLDIGFENAGFEISVCVESDAACCSTLRANHPNLKIIEKDITHVSTKEILNVAELKPLEAAAVIGGPPCQSFSLAGTRMGMNDPRGKLLLEFIRVVKGTLPAFFIMENVKGMANWKEGRAINAIIKEFEEIINYNNDQYHYSLKYKVLNAANYGVPQFRERLFIIGNRLGKNFEFPNPTHGFYDSQTMLFENKLKPYVSVWDAIKDLPPADAPSKTALRVSQTIKGRIEKHGY